jgi:HEAT repeat protein
VAWHAAASLEKHGAAAVPALRAVLTDPAVPADSGALAVAATSLARLGDAASLKPLLDRLDAAKGDTRTSLVWGLGELLKRHPDAPDAAAARQALTAASQRADDPDAARLARYALSKAPPQAREEKK